MPNLSSFKLLDLDAHPIQLLSIYKGKPLLVLFFHVDCLGCTGRAIPLAYQFMNDFENLEVVAVHSTLRQKEVTKNDIINIFTNKELPFPIFFDQGKDSYEAFEAEGTPHWILLDEKGNLFRSIFGSQASAQNRLDYALRSLY